MNKTKAIERLEAIKKEAEELEKIINEEDMISWWPELCQSYYYIVATGEVRGDSCNGDRIDHMRRLNGNIFRTREIAEKVAKRRAAVNYLECIALELNDGWEPNWEAGSPFNSWFYLRFDPEFKRISPSCCFGDQRGLFPVFKNLPLAERAIKLMPDEHKAALGWNQ